jgi:DnaK suppressor protein
MTALERERLRGIIKQQIDILQQDIANLELLVTPIAPDVAIGRLSRMEAIAEKGVNQTKLHQSRQKLANLKQTLPRLDSPEYGVCEVCDSPIPLARLVLMPDTRSCVTCLEKQQGS